MIVTRQTAPYSVNRRLTKAEGDNNFIFLLNACIPIEVTYSELAALIGNGQLRPGSYYCITDYQTIYDIPDYDIDNSNVLTVKNTIATHQGPIEEIIVLALSSNSLHSRAYSLSFSQDEIYYDYTFNQTEINLSPAKGIITYRKDTRKNIETDFDFRNAVFKRYDRSGDTDYTRLGDTGSDGSQLVPPFDLDATFNVSITGSRGCFTETNFKLPDFTFTTSCENFSCIVLHTFSTTIASEVKASVIKRSTFYGSIVECNVSTILDTHVAGQFKHNIGGSMDSLVLNSLKKTTFNEVSGLDLSSATFIYQDNPKQIYTTPAGTYKVGYVNNSGGFQIEDLTD